MIGAAGMGGALGQPQGDTGVGASPTITSRSQPTGQQYGGKGGGMGGPQLQQPAQASTTESQTSQKYQPMGGNVFGYNMNRLASRMDPSASLPGDNSQQYPFQYPAQYQPQTLANTFPAGTFGGKGGGGYQPQFFQPQYQQPQQTQQAQPAQPAQPTQQAQPAQQQNPFVQPTYDKQFADLQAQINKLLSQGTSAAKPVEDTTLKDKGEAVTALDKTRTDMGAGTNSYVAPTPTISNADVRSTQAAATPPPAALTAGAGFRDINSQYGNMLGNVNATVGKNGAITLVSNANKNVKTTLPAGSYFDSAKKQFVDSSGRAVNVGSQFLSPQATNLSSGIQYGDTAADVRTEFGKVVNVTDKAKVNSDGSVTLQNGTKIPANSYIDSNNVLRAPNGSVVAIKPKDLPTTPVPAVSAPPPAVSAPAPAPANLTYSYAPSPAAAAPAPSPVAAPSSAAEYGPVIQSAPAPAPSPVAAPAPAPASIPTLNIVPAPAPAPRASPLSIFNPVAAPAPAPKASPLGLFGPFVSAPAPAPTAKSLFGPFAEGGIVKKPKAKSTKETKSKTTKKAKGGTVIVHKGMTSNLKKQLKNK